MIKDIKTISSIKELSNRTCVKIVKRLNCGCAICGWKKAPCDTHHIVEVAKGGLHSMNNLIVVCPNHHREIHAGTVGLTEQELLDKTIEKLFPNWKDFYNPRIPRTHKICSMHGCGNLVSRGGSNYCSKKCFAKSKIKMTLTNEKMKNLIKKHNGILTSIAREIGFSDNAIRKYCKRNNIEIERIKYKRIR